MANDDDIKEEIENEEETSSYEEDTSNENPVANVTKAVVSAKTFKLKLIVIIFAVVFFLILFLVIDEDNILAENNDNCSKISMLNTTLTRSDFISLVTSYLSSYSSKTATLFIENAGLIYDLGKQIGANPEMIYIIADKEQQWDDTIFTLECNNFYGMGVYNGQSTGKCFSNFRDGVKYELEYIKNKGTLNDLVKVYSYLGKYLANPGSWGDGGCIYLKLDDIYGPNYSRCNDSYKCASSNGGPGCVLTTDAERQAYVDWQAKIILEKRTKIFKLGEDACQVTEGVDGSTVGTTFMTESLSDFLAKQNTSLQEFNNKVIKEGCKGIGTGAGVANTAATAVSELAKYGKRFHYLWGGMHMDSPPIGYGVPGSWGPPGTGPDCSGFVSWALYNAGFTWKSLGATAWGALGTQVNLGDSRIEVGDFIVTPGNIGFNHIVIITAVHKNEGYYSVVEAASTKTGVVFNKVKISEAKNRKAILMKDYYTKASKSQEFEAMCQQGGFR